MAEVSDILAKLLERTNQNKVSWQTTVDDDAFIAVLGNASVRIHVDQYSDTILKILNNEGREIEQIDSGVDDGSQWKSELNALYLKARRIALGVDSELDELLRELEAEV